MLFIKVSSKQMTINSIIIITDIWYSAFSNYNVQKRFKKSQWTYFYGPSSQINSFRNSYVSAVSGLEKKSLFPVIV